MNPLKLFVVTSEESDGSNPGGYLQSILAAAATSEDAKVIAACAEVWGNPDNYQVREVGTALVTMPEGVVQKFYNRDHDF